MTNTVEIGGWLARVLQSANASPGWVSGIACFGMATPAVWTSAAAMTGSLGQNPLEILIREPGRWSFVWLVLALAIAPLRQLLMQLSRATQWRYGKRLSDWNWLVRLRRPIGLACFFYAALHFALYVMFNLDGNRHELWADLCDKPFIVAGGLCLLLLAPLALTSTDGWMRRLKRNWKRLHLLIYPAALLAELHFVLLSKPGIRAPLWYGVAVGGLLAYRLVQVFLPPAPRAENLDGTAPERAVGKQRDE